METLIRKSVVVVSDVHLGHKRSNFKQFNDFLEWIGAASKGNEESNSVEAIFNSEIRRIRKKYRDAYVCSFCHVNQDDYLKVTLELGARILQPGFNTTYLTEDWVERVHESGCVCNVFYADTVSNLLYCQHVGVDAVLTNFPDTFLKVF